MDCFCGCETRIPRRLNSVQIVAGEVAFELLAWDKARSGRGTVPADAPDEHLIAAGAACYQRLLATLHGSPDDGVLRESETWLEESRAQRRELPGMTDKRPLISTERPVLTEWDYSQLNRKSPELSFSEVPPPTTQEPTEKDPASQLASLEELHRLGALTDEEFAAARARVSAQL